MNNCYKCIMERTDGLVLINPTIYFIESNRFTIGNVGREDSPPEQSGEEIDEEPF